MENGIDVKSSSSTVDWQSTGVALRARHRNDRIQYHLAWSEHILVDAMSDGDADYGLLAHD